MLRKILIICACVVCSPSYSQPDLPAAFTPEELRDQARTYVQVIEGKEPGSLEKTIKISQFYGYILGHLDAVTAKPTAEKIFIDCTKKSPNEVTLKAAKAILNSKLDRSEPVRFTAIFAVAAACNDKFWK
jgi:hypothetical protein